MAKFFTTADLDSDDSLIIVEPVEDAYPADVTWANESYFSSDILLHHTSTALVSHQKCLFVPLCSI